MRFWPWYYELKDELAKQKRADFIQLFISFVIAAALLFSIFIFINGELKFLGKETNEAKVEVKETYMRHIGRGKYYQDLEIEFTHDSQLYTVRTSVGKSIGMRQKGQFVKIRYVVNNPQKLKVVGYYAESKDPNKNYCTHGVFSKQKNMK